MPVSLLIAVFAPGPDAGPSTAARVAKRLQEDWDEEARGVALDVLELPRAYRAATEAVQAALLERRPDLFLLYDTDPASEEYKLHHLAANYDDDPTPDATGEVRQDHIIDPNGPVAFRTRLPLDGIWDKLLVERVPVRMSHKARHVFNHVYYRAMQAIHDRLPTRGGAIETPPLPEDAATPEVARDLDRLVEEATMIVAVLRRLAAAPLDLDER